MKLTDSSSYQIESYRGKFLKNLLTCVLALLIVLCLSACDNTNSGDNPGANILSEWTVLGPNDSTIARIITEDIDCPTISITAGSTSNSIDSREIMQTMDVRQGPSDSDFPVLVCQSTIPTDTKSASIGSVEFPLPKDSPKRIATIGDTGCRLDSKDDKFQDCNDPSKWPFNTIAQSAAAWGPDLIIHVGDYI